MTEKYSYLKKYVGHNDLKGTYFLKLNKDIILKAEKNMNGLFFPNELKEFYYNVGYGILSCGEIYPDMYMKYATNEILSPDIAVDFMNGVIEHLDSNYYMAESFYEIMDPGDLPFFEIGDSSNYLIMKLKSDNPNAVWAIGGIKIEDSFEKFIWRLYYESPTFYDDIIEAHYSKK